MESYGGPDPGERTVRELASELGITVKEAMALVTVSGTAVRNPDQRLSAAQVRKARQVLEGKAKMAAPKPARPPVPLKTVGVVVGVLALIGIAVVVANFLTQPSSIRVQAGDCFENPDIVAFNLDPVPCSSPEADYRAFAVLRLTDVYGDEYPGVEELQRRGEERCAALAPPVDPAMGIMGPQLEFFFPNNQQAWDSRSARKIVCAEPV